MENPIVEVQQGTLRGKTGVDYKGNKYHSFQGIPYAKPPIGPLRFKAPQPPEPWTGTRDATEEGDECFSRYMMVMHHVGSENCLTLNVYTPALPSKTQRKCSKPVMVWIHGGGFTGGTSKALLYGPEFLLPEDVVVVTINYRFGVLGFLNLDDPSLGVPGNAGLKDMVMALQWIKENISTFLGDPNNVTIFGESAGGASVHCLMLSPMAKGLFHKAIAQSGCALNTWTLTTGCAKELAKILGCGSTKEKDILQFLQALPVEKIFEGQEQLKDSFSASFVRPVAPVVEKPANEPVFFPQHPLDILKSGNYSHVPLMIGYTSREGMLMEFFKPPEGETPSNFFENSVPHNLNVAKGSQLSKEIARKIQEFYFHGEEVTENNKNFTYVLNTDNLFLREILDAIKYHVKSSWEQVYFYRFSVDAGLNGFKLVTEIKEPGASHSDELGYLFKNMGTPEIFPNSVEDITIKRMTKLWATFARFGNPNPTKKDPLIPITWKPVTKEELTFLDIGENLTVGVNPEMQRIEFWNEIRKMKSIKAKL